MSLDPEIRDANRAATDRIRTLAGRLSDDQLRQPLGEHWTVAIMLAHLAFWDRRALDAVARSESAASVPDVDVVVNDLSLALWAALPPREAARLAIESAEALDPRIEMLPDAVTAGLLVTNPHWIRRSIHRNLHLDEAEAAIAWEP